MSFDRQSSIVARVYIIRHGETDENRKGIIQGQLDTRLNDEGRLQAERVAEALRDAPVQFERAWTSDLGRAVATAEAILKYHPDVKLEKQKELRERYLGELQGKPATDRSIIGYETAERAEDMLARGRGWWRDTVLSYASDLTAASALSPRDPPSVLAVSHGGFISTLLRGLTADGSVQCAEGVQVGHCPNTAICIVEIHTVGEGKELKGLLVQYGDIKHLEGGVGVVQGNADEQTMPKPQDIAGC